MIQLSRAASSLFAPACDRPSAMPIVSCHQSGRSSSPVYLLDSIHFECIKQPSELASKLLGWEQLCLADQSSHPLCRRAGKRANDLGYRSSSINHRRFILFVYFTWSWQRARGPRSPALSAGLDVIAQVRRACQR